MSELAPDINGLISTDAWVCLTMQNETSERRFNPPIHHMTSKRWLTFWSKGDPTKRIRVRYDRGH